jgi:hypothetical protein
MSTNPAGPGSPEPDQPARSWRLSLPVLGGGVALAVVCVAAVVLLLSSGTSSAFAGWASVPSQPSRAAVARAREDCGRGRPLPPAGVIAVETTGPFSAILYQRNGSQFQCVIRGHVVLMNQVPMGVAGTLSRPTAGGVQFPQASRVLVGDAEAQQRTLMSGVQTTNARSPAKALAAVASSPDSLQVVSGQVATGVQRVIFVLRDGVRVHATIAHGRYLAWWPTNNRKVYANAPASILIGTARGTTKAPYSAARLFRYFRLCLKALC